MSSLDNSNNNSPIKRNGNKIDHYQKPNTNNNSHPFISHYNHHRVSMDASTSPIHQSVIFATQAEQIEHMTKVIEQL